MHLLPSVPSPAPCGRAGATGSRSCGRAARKALIKLHPKPSRCGHGPPVGASQTHAAGDHFQPHGNHRRRGATESVPVNNFSRHGLGPQGPDSAEGPPQHRGKARRQSVCLVNARTQRSSTFKGDRRERPATIFNMSFQDRTFCPLTDCAKAHRCPRGLTPAIQQEAEKWWGGPNPPFSLFDVTPETKPCYSSPEDDGKPVNL